METISVDSDGSIKNEKNGAAAGPVRIFCYTGTGNSFAAAKQLGAALNVKPEFIIGEIADKNFSVETGSLIIVAPSYAYGLPKTVKRFLKNAAIKAEYIAIIITMGTKQKGTAAEGVKILKKRGLAVHYTAGVQSVENFVHIFGHPSEQIQKERIASQKENVARLIEIVKNKERNITKLYQPASKLVSGFFRAFSPIFPALYRVKPACTGCRICEKVCPAAAITMRDKKIKGKVKKIPRFKARKCDFCQACMQLCPAKAIKYGKIKPDSPRYIHHDVKLNELIKRD